MALTRPRYSQIYDSDFKNSARVATDTNITLAGAAPNTVDGITLALNDRIVVKSQTTPSQNGIYRVSVLGTGSNGTWIRTLDADTSSKLSPGTSLSIEEGTLYGGKLFRMTSPNPVTLGVSEITWTDVSGGGGASTGGTNGQFQYNNSNNLAGSTYLYYNSATGVVTANSGVASSSTSTGALVVSGGLGVSGKATMGNIVTTSGVFWSNGASFSSPPGGSTSQIQYNSSSQFAGATDFTYSAGSGNIVIGTTTASNGLTSGALVVKGGTAIGGNLFIGGNLTVTGNTVFQNSVIETTTEIVQGISIVSGNLVANSGTTSTTTTTGALVVVGGVGITGALNVGGATAITGNLTITGNVLPSANITYNLGSPSQRWADLYLSGNTINLNGATISSADGSITFKNNQGGSFSVTGAASGQSTGTFGNLIANSGVASSSTSTGALVVTGGTGISGATYIGGLLNVAGTMQVTGTSNYTGSGNFAGGIISSTISAGTIGNTGATLTGTLSTAAQTNITSLGTLTGLAVAGTVTTQQHNPSANLTYDLGSSTAWWRTLYGVSTQAKYADLAENYLADAAYPPGTVLVFGGINEVTTTSTSHDTAVAGIVSTNPAHLMNGLLQGETVVALGLTGRVPCRVQGPVAKGDVLVTSTTPGVAQRIGSEYRPGCVIGKALETINSNIIETIEVVVGRF